MSQSDPTDSALAAIASILDHPVDHPEAHHEPAATQTVTAIVEEQPLAAAAPIEAHGYSKVGPGPMAAIRFRWTARRDEDGHFYVDETIGENAAPITTGPMSSDAAIRMVDDRESEARFRFEQLKEEMTGRSAAASVARGDGSET